MIDWPALSRLIPEALMVVIVLGYIRDQAKQQAVKDAAREQAALEREAAMAAREEARELRQNERDQRRDDSFISAMANRDKEWRDFMSVERTRQAEGLANLAHEITPLVALAAATNQLISMHDKWEREELERRLPMRPATGPLHPHKETE